MMMGPTAPAMAYAVHVKPYNVENERRPKYRESRYGVTSPSPPIPNPMSAAAPMPSGSDRAPASKNVPSAESANRQTPTRGAKNRSSSHPVSRRPDKIAPPMADTAKAALAAEIPRSVSSAERWGITPFLLMEMRNSSATMIQKIRDRTPSLTVAPEIGVAAVCLGSESSRTREPHGNPMAKTAAPKIAKEARHPIDRISASAMGGRMMAPVALPPRRIEN